MTDRFRQSVLGRLWYCVLRTTGRDLVSLPIQFLRRIGIDVGPIEEKKIEMRELNHTFEVMANDPLALQYANERSFKTGSDLIWKDDYFMDTVMSLGQLSTRERDMVNTLYITDKNDCENAQYLLGKISPTSVYIDTTKDDSAVYLPPFDTVKKIFIIGGDDHNVDACIENIEELQIPSLTPYYLSLISDAKNLQYLSIKGHFSTGDIHDSIDAIKDLPQILERRRVNTNTMLKGFRLYFEPYMRPPSGNKLDMHQHAVALHYDPSDIDQQFLCEELEMHQLEVLELMVTNTIEFKKLIHRQKWLKTLIIHCFVDDVIEIAQMIRYNFPHLERLMIHCDDVVSIERGLLKDIYEELEPFIKESEIIKECRVVGIVVKHNTQSITMSASDLIQNNIIRSRSIQEVEMIHKLRQMVLPIDERDNVFDNEDSLFDYNKIMPMKRVVNEDGSTRTEVSRFGEHDSDLYPQDEIDRMLSLEVDYLMGRDLDARRDELLLEAVEEERQDRYRYYED